MNILDEIKNGEGKTLEFKQKLPNGENIARTIVAFSNTSGGKLIIGVNDKREILGIDDDDIFTLSDKIASIVFDTCSPNILPEIYTINVEGKLLLVIEVFRGNLLPYFIKSLGKNKGTYIRIGATNQKADFENIVELERQKRHISYDEEIYLDVEFKKLDLAVLFEKFKSINKPLSNEKLKNLKLIKKIQNKVYPTNALMILLGLFSHTCIKCARFKGVTMEVFIDKKEYSGDIFSVLENAQNFILNHINLKGEIKSLQRTDTYEIPQTALREALINALIHRDYANFGRDIKVGIYDDMVNIVSPGGFPNTITPLDIQNGRSEIRNKVIANVFKELGLIEQWGSGINRIKIACEKNGLKTPKIEEQNDFVDVEIYRPPIKVGIPKTTQKTTQKTIPKTIPKTTQKTTQKTIPKTTQKTIPKTTQKTTQKSSKDKILEFLRFDSKLTREDLSNKVGVSVNAIKQHLSNLQKEGKLKRVGGRKEGYWEVLDK